MPERCKFGGEWRYTQEEMEAGAPGGIAPAPVEGVADDESVMTNSEALPPKKRATRK